jgi:calreticulin
MKTVSKVLVLLGAVVLVSCEVFFEEKFVDDSWEKNWVQSKHSGKEFGVFKRTAGKFFNDEVEDAGLQTSQDARFYGVSTKFTPFTNKDKPLVIQFSVKHEQNVDCAGAYLKVFDCSLDQKDLHGESPYLIMFGPDICGPGTKKVHVIFSYKGKNHLIKKEVRCKDDVFTHFYTLVVQPDNTYEVLIDNEKVESGSLEEDWDFLPPKTIKDPEAKKPEDWDERPTIADPDDTKPEDWDKPEHIPDPDATKPEDWDDELDGEWEPPQIDNPEYKGEWKAKQIDNPAYKGAWKHPEIDNPEYAADENLYLREEVCTVGLDLWQVKSGTIFDNFLFTDDAEYAKEAAAGFKATQDGEKKMKDAQDEEERKKAEAEAKTEEKDEDNEDLDDEIEDKVDGEAEAENHDEL